MEIAHKSSMFLESLEGGRGGSHLIHPASAAGPEPSERLGAESLPRCQQTYFEAHKVAPCCTCWSGALEESAFKI